MRGSKVIGVVSDLAGPEHARRWALVVLSLSVAFAAGGCQLIALYLTPVAPMPSAMPIATQPPLEPLGPAVAAGRVEMAGSGFAITVPDDWAVEVAAPEPELDQAAPGDAWEALRAYAPDRTAGCSISVGVAQEDRPSLEQTAGVGTSGTIDRPRWIVHEGVPTLQVREPAIVSTQLGRYTTVGSHERTRANDPGLAHEVLYAVVCAAASERDVTPITDSFELLPGGG